MQRTRLRQSENLGGRLKGERDFEVDGGMDIRSERMCW